MYNNIITIILVILILILIIYLYKDYYRTGVIDFFTDNQIYNKELNLAFNADYSSKLFIDLPVGGIKFDSRNYQKKNILLISLDNRKDSLREMIEIHNSSMNRYANKYGYKYIFLDSYDSQLPVYWWKIQIVKEMLETNQYDYVVWMDTDTIIIENENTILPLEYLIEISKDKSIFMGIDYYSHFIEFFTYCSGVFMIKNDHHGKKFLEDCIQDYLNNKNCISNEGKYILGGKWAGECYEQGVMNKLIKEGGYSFRTFKIPIYFCLNHNDYITPSVILHYYLNKEKALSFFKKYLENII